MSVPREQCHTKRNRCPICGGADQDIRGKSKRCFGFSSADGEWVHCSREELAGSLDQKDNLFRHKMSGACRCGANHGGRSPEHDIVATYDYTDEVGALLFQVVRKVGKQFRQRKPDGNGGWEWKLGDIRRVPYHLPRLRAAASDATVYIVEGEKDVETLEARGLVATCNPGGAGKWHFVAEVAREAIDARPVIVIADKDLPGYRHAQQVAASLPKATILECPDTKDISDHLAAGGSLADLRPINSASYDDEPPDPVAPNDDDEEVPLEDTDAEIFASQPRTNDEGNAQAVLAYCGKDFRYAVKWTRWLAWTGTHWALKGAEHRLFRCVVKVAQREYHFCLKRIAAIKKELVEESKRNGLNSPKGIALADQVAAENILLKWHHQSQNKAKVEACITQLESCVGVDHEDLDEDPWLLNCENGTVDLRTGDLRPHERDDLITRCLAIPFLAEQRAPAWENFLSQCMGGSALLTTYLQRLVGYTLTASTQEHLLVFCYGTGSNGKSTFLRVLQNLLGPYAVAAPRTMLFAQKAGEVHPTELATLYGRRLGVCSEVGEDAALDEAKVKDLTGGDVISCRRMHEDFWDFAPTHKLWLGGNHRPVIKGTDDGIWRRLRVVPWLVKFDGETKDPTLSAKLAAEIPGVLAWAVKGCLEWQRVGIADPPDVLDATAQYRGNSDVLGEFFKAHVVFHADGRMAAKALRSIYESWCEEMGHLPVGARKFGARLRIQGVTDTTMRADGRVINAWAGARLLAAYERPVDA